VSNIDLGDYTYLLPPRSRNQNGFYDPVGVETQRSRQNICTFGVLPSRSMTWYHAGSITDAGLCIVSPRPKTMTPPNLWLISNHQPRRHTATSRHITSPIAHHRPVSKFRLFPQALCVGERRGKLVSQKFGISILFPLTLPKIVNGWRLSTSPLGDSKILSHAKGN